MTKTLETFSHRCMWCGKLSDNGLSRLGHRKDYEGILVPTHTPIWACTEHSRLVENYLLEQARRSGQTLIGRLLVIVLVVVGGVVGSNEVVASGVLVCGAWLLLYPYATPETVRRIGVSNSRFLVRWLGGLVLTAGAVWLGILVSQ